MSKLILIRHGQASFGSQDYDQLSTLGMQQAQWLGEFFSDAGITPTRIITGDMKRHLQTAEGIANGFSGSNNALPTSEQHSGWNEFDFHAIGQAYLTVHPKDAPKEQTPRDFFSVLRKSLKAWSENKLGGSLPESWSCFESRVYEAMKFACAKSKNETVLLISSGGAISMALKHIMRFDNETLINLNLQTRNTGVSDIYFNQRDRYLLSFNSISHLDTPERRASITSA